MFYPATFSFSYLYLLRALSLLREFRADFESYRPLQVSTHPLHQLIMSSVSLPRRKALVTRNTKETKIQLHLSLDGGPLAFLEPNPEFEGSSIPSQDLDTHASQITVTQHIWIWTGIGFLDHMLHALAKHAGWSLRLRSKGDLLSRIRPRFVLELD